MTTLDWTVLSVYLVAIVAFGMWAGRGARRMDDFFLAGRQMPWWAIGLSVMATQVSAITFVGTTGQAYTDGMRFLTTYFALPFAMVILCVTLVPFFYRSGVYTAYQYLERRFDARTRTLTSLLFLLSRGLAVGVTLYAPSLVLSVILGWSEPVTILLVGGSTILYVLYGGNRSVIWTDVVQMGLIWFGIFLCFGAALSQLPADFGLQDALALAQTTDRLRIMDTDPSLSKPYTLWTGLIASLFLMLSYFGCDQSQVQRYLAGASLTQSRLALLFNAFLKVPMQFIILLTGVLVFVFYHFHVTPLLWNPVELTKLESRLPPAEMQALKARHEQAHHARQEAARAFARSRAAGQEPDVKAYLAAQTRLERARTATVERVKALNGEDKYDDRNYIFPTYILSHIPKGLAGLVIAVIFAAAMSSLSGEFNSLASASMIDFYKRYLRPAATEAQDLLVSRVLTGLWGAFACLIALEAGRLGSVIEVVNKFGSYFYGPILGVFGLAILAPKVTGRGAFYGLIAGVGMVFAVAFGTNVHYLWYNLVGAVGVFVAGSLIDFLGSAQE